jgi:hypothetical protein
MKNSKWLQHINNAMALEGVILEQKLIGRTANGR